MEWDDFMKPWQAGAQPARFVGIDHRNRGTVVPADPRCVGAL